MVEMPVTLTWVSGWRCSWRLWYPVLFLNLWIRIFGPLVWATTSPVTATLASTAASVTRSSPSTRSTAESDTASPGEATSFSTSITSPSATLYCLPPVLTIAYIGRGLLSFILNGPCRGRTATRRTNVRRLTSLRHRLRRDQTGSDAHPAEWVGGGRHPLVRGRYVARGPHAGQERRVGRQRVVPRRHGAHGSDQYRVRGRGTGR